jgi:hypothetical protein
MMTLKNNPSGSPRAINVAILLLIIFNSGGITLVEHFYITIATLYLLLVKLFFSRNFSITLATKIMGIASAFVLFNLVATASWGGRGEYIVLLSYILIATLLLVFYRTSNEDFISDLILALKIILIHSLIGFFFQFVGKSYLFDLNDRIKTFSYIFFYLFEDGIARNQGIFWEPGVTQIFFNILLYICLFIRKNNTLATLSAIAIITTLSTAGYLILAMLVLVSTLKNVRRSYWNLAAVITLVPIVLAATTENFYDKFNGKNAKSADVRMFDIAVGVKLLTDHPVLGVGLDQTLYKKTFFDYGLDKIKEYHIAEDELEGKGITNSVLFVAGAFGLPLALLLMRLLYKQTLLPGPRITLFLVFFISGLSEPIFNTAFFSLFFISGFLDMSKLATPRVQSKIKPHHG